MGREWYDGGRLKNKLNTFYDFIDVTEALIKMGYGTAGHVYAEGASAGGLLVGAVVNMRPDLYRGIGADVPFVDALTTMLDKSIPLTVGEYDEWGNPNKKADYFYIKKYSPYDQIKKQKYPHILVTGAFEDSQVQYWEPAKWVAKLRTYKTDKNVLLLHTNMETGHSGATGRFAQHKETAMEYAFFISLTF
jgi:oligopeptidase B